MLYTSHATYAEGKTWVSWKGMLLCSCDGTEKDKKAVMDMMKDIYRKEMGCDWFGSITVVGPNDWHLIDSPLIANADGFKTFSIPGMSPNGRKI